MGFLRTTESQDLGLTSHPKDGAFWLYSVPFHYTGALGPTQTTGWASPSGLTNTSSISNLVFPGGLPSRYWPGSNLLSFSGQPVLGCRVIWLWLSISSPYTILSIKCLLNLIKDMQYMLANKLITCMLDCSWRTYKHCAQKVITWQ